MNRSSRAVWLVLVACGQVLAAELKNPSFEDSLDPNDPIQHLAADWGTWGGWMNRETGWKPVHSGTCIIGYHHFRINDANTSGIYQDVADVPAGSMCTFKIFVCKDPNTLTKSVELRLEPLGGGSAIAATTFAPGDIKIRDWTSLSVSGKIPLAGVRVVVEVTPKADAPRDGAIKFDDASLDAGQAVP